jgi:superkiller protein 3
MARDSFGMALLLAGRRAEAAEQIAKARELRLRSAAGAAPGEAAPHDKLGLLLRQEGRTEEALAEFRKAVEIEPANAAAHCDLGSALVALDKPDEAASEFEAALALDRRSAPAWYGLGEVWERRGARERAMSSWREALALDANYAEAHLRLAHALSERGENAEALKHWRAGLQRQPNDLQALREAAWVLATSADASLRNGSEALALAVRALELSEERTTRSKGKSNGDADRGEEDISILDTLAAAYAECGRFSDAVLTARRALASGKYTRAGDLKRRVDLYERQMPFHETRVVTP